MLIADLRSVKTRAHILQTSCVDGTGILALAAPLVELG